MPRILVVDNDKNSTETMKVALSVNQDYVIDVVHGGEAALEKMKINGEYDLVLLDLMMPRVSGIDVCKEMIQNENFKKIPVLVVSALPVQSPAFQESQGKFTELSVIKGVLEKPFSIEELRKKVQAMVKS